ncbi:hypothetical protein [Helicobacter cetorum]|uniref:hypothetical protein n=1 Tax=Helicobacter cetorum TaxID=138563 RepID=UPI000CF16C8F|nr:hypothetical protein [Helicobacter cetorum]
MNAYKTFLSLALISSFAFAENFNNAVVEKDIQNISQYTNTGHIQGLFNQAKNGQNVAQFEQSLKNLNSTLPLYQNAHNDTDIYNNDMKIYSGMSNATIQSDLKKLSSLSSQLTSGSTSAVSQMSWYIGDGYGNQNKVNSVKNYVKNLENEFQQAQATLQNDYKNAEVEQELQDISKYTNTSWLNELYNAGKHNKGYERQFEQTLDNVINALPLFKNARTESSVYQNDIKNYGNVSNSAVQNDLNTLKTLAHEIWGNYGNSGTNQLNWYVSDGYGNQNKVNSVENYVKSLENQFNQTQANLENDYKNAMIEKDIQTISQYTNTDYIQGLFNQAKNDRNVVQFEQSLKNLNSTLPLFKNAHNDTDTYNNDVKKYSNLNDATIQSDLKKLSSLSSQLTSGSTSAVSQMSWYIGDGMGSQSKVNSVENYVEHLENEFNQVQASLDKAYKNVEVKQNIQTISKYVNTSWLNTLYNAGKTNAGYERQFEQLLGNLNNALPLFQNAYADKTTATNLMKEYGNIGGAIQNDLKQLQSISNKLTGYSRTSGMSQLNWYLASGWGNKQQIAQSESYVKNLENEFNQVQTNLNNTLKDYHAINNLANTLNQFSPYYYNAANQIVQADNNTCIHGMSCFNHQAYNSSVLQTEFLGNTMQKLVQEDEQALRQFAKDPSNGQLALKIKAINNALYDNALRADYNATRGLLNKEYDSLVLQNDKILEKDVQEINTYLEHNPTIANAMHHHIDEVNHADEDKDYSDNDMDMLDRFEK